MSDTSHLSHLLDVMAMLRDKEKGCPWDLSQNFTSIAPYAIEEAYEVAEAIHHGDMVELKNELGDLLLQVVFHAQMASEQGIFTFEDVAKGISDKMIHRHPHVFADATAPTLEEYQSHWESIKAEERAKKPALQSILDDVPHAFPALMRAVKLQKRAARVGFDWEKSEDIYDKIREELEEVKDAEHDAAHLEEEIGDLLFAATNLARYYGIEPESALRQANRKFETRFRYIESTLKARGKAPKDSTLEEMEAIWCEAKALKSI